MTDKRDAAGDPVDDPYEIETDIGPDGPLPETDDDDSSSSGDDR